MRSKTFIANIRKGMNYNLRPKFKNCIGVAILDGPAPVIEVIVKNASAESGIEMDWGYIAGRGVVYALGDKKKARNALVMSFPQSNLDSFDIFGL